MSFEDITIVRRFPVINGFVIIPDYGANEIPLATALTIPGVTLNALTGSVEMFIDTTPGLVECCGNVPADHISETIKEEVPGYPPTPSPSPSPYPTPCICPFDIDTFNLTYLTVQFLDAQGVAVYIQQEICGCSNSFTGSELMILSPMTRAEEEGYPRCSWIGYTILQDFRIIVSYDTVNCRWVITLYCLIDDQFGAIWQGSSSDSLPYGSYTTLNDGPTWCAPIYTANVSQYQPG